jgi:hypothetical protein
MKLRRIQESFSDALITQNAQTGKLFESTLRSNSRIPKQLAVDIYRNNARGSRIKALQEVYPVIEQILGEQCFYQIAHDYVLEHPSNNSDLNVYGEVFSDFIMGLVQHNYAFYELPYLYDLARLEWSFNAAYYADDDTNHLVDLNKDASLITLTASHALGLLQSEYPVYEIWRAHTSNNEITEIAALTETEYLVVCRNGFRPEISRVDAEDWQLLTEIMKTTNMCALAEFSDYSDIELDKRLPALIQRGWVMVS